MAVTHSSSHRILIFDSGIGGLSVLRSAYARFPLHQYHYLADNAYWPYGPKSANDIQQRLKSLFRHIDIEAHYDIIVIACNTASTSALGYLRQHFNIPFIGVVPAIKPAAVLSQTKTIALLATQTTVSGQYVKTLEKDFASDCQLLNFALPELVELSEHFIQYQDTDYLQQALQPVIQRIKQHPQAHNIDSFILGCTHFPLLKEQLSLAWQADVHWVDSGDAIAQRINQISHAISSQLNPHRVLTTAATSPTLFATNNTASILDLWLPYFNFSGIQQAQLIENVR